MTIQGEKIQIINTKGQFVTGEITDVRPMGFFWFVCVVVLCPQQGNRTDEAHELSFEMNWLDKLLFGTFL